MASNGEVVDMVDPDLPRKISEEDRLAVENLYLRIENLALQQKLLQADLTKSGEMIKEAQQKLVAKSQEFQKKYGIKLGRDKISTDGTILEIDGRPVEPSRS